nr:MAG TPA: hypothetical protein [Caudoviricetes sp.]
MKFCKNRIFQFFQFLNFSIFSIIPPIEKKFF